MKINQLFIELALESHPNHVIEVGAVGALPAVGDYVDRENTGWWGYVTRRRWKVREDGTGIDVRLWLHLPVHVGNHGILSHHDRCRTLAAV